MKIIGKNKPPTSFDCPYKAEIENVITAQADKKDLQFDTIRTFTNESVPDGHIMQIALDMGYEVKP